MSLSHTSIITVTHLNVNIFRPLFSQIFRFGKGLRLTLYCEPSGMDTVVKEVLGFRFSSGALMGGSSGAGAGANANSDANGPPSPPTEAADSSIVLIHRVEQALLFQLPSLKADSGGELTAFLKLVEGMKLGGGGQNAGVVKSISIGQCTLEDVFLKISDNVEQKMKESSNKGKQKKANNYVSLNDTATSEDILSLQRLFDNSKRATVIGSKFEFFKNVFFATFNKTFKYMTRTGKKNMIMLTVYIIAIAYLLSWIGSIFDPIFLESACGDPEEYLRKWQTGELNASKGDIFVDIDMRVKKKKYSITLRAA